MSNNTDTNTAGTPALSNDEQKQLIKNAIEQRFPGTNFKEWSYYYVGHLLNYRSLKGFVASEYGTFITDLMLFLMKHNLSEAFAREVSDYPFEILENLLHFFQAITDSEQHYAFADHFFLHVTGQLDPEKLVELAKCYMTGPDRERVYAANPEVDHELI